MKKYLKIQTDISQEESFEKFCKATGADMTKIYLLIGAFTGNDETKMKDLHTLLSMAFFSGVYVAKKHKKRITFFDKVEIEEEEKEKKHNYFG